MEYFLTDDIIIYFFYHFFFFQHMTLLKVVFSGDANYPPVYHFTKPMFDCSKTYQLPV